ncbi:hypothetical protein GCM10010172_64210 [Paractinoplanes ferrugineus]|uniref:Inositolphosphotransferase Aur1/Ipt1 domain-containing protein n=1 Tax=Paractinoplanes ferrugineus TaxID=113564 RepID=A0A919MIH0_9ACTN|nr:phosphatase PAP2 family protein [Actinoplanes ferrugineus]GIE16009.1 hypothetical protein Afe05nite_78490 [Actinoplanes ferrugineus]
MSGDRLRRAARELLLVAALFLAYKLGRLVVEGHVTEAFTDAGSVWDLERLLHLPSEASLQAAAIHHTWLIRAANCYYAYVHFPATAATLIWLYLRRPELYRWFRRTLASLTALALVTHALFPLAPPRMLDLAGLLDTGKTYGPSVYGSPTTDTLSNQYAAMPSLHVGWALAVAIALVAATRSRLRWLWLAHPITTLLVVVVTGNHYWLDAIAAVGLLSLVLAVVTPLSRSSVPAPALPATPFAGVTGVTEPPPAASPALARPDGGDPEPQPLPAAAAVHPLLAPCVQLATLVPGAALTAFLPGLLTGTPAPAPSAPAPAPSRPIPSQRSAASLAGPPPRVVKAGGLPVPPEPRRATAPPHAAAPLPAAPLPAAPLPAAPLPAGAASAGMVADTGTPPAPAPTSSPAASSPVAPSPLAPSPVVSPPVPSPTDRPAGDSPGRPGARSSACLPPRQAAASAPSRPPFPAAVTRPGPAAPRSRTTRNR